MSLSLAYLVGSFFWRDSTPLPGKQVFGFQVFQAKMIREKSKSFLDNLERLRFTNLDASYHGRNQILQNLIGKVRKHGLPILGRKIVANAGSTSDRRGRIGNPP